MGYFFAGKRIIQKTSHRWWQGALSVVAAFQPQPLNKPVTAPAPPRIVPRPGRFAYLATLPTYRIPRSRARLNLVIDSINDSINDRIKPGSPSGKAATAVVLSALLAEQAGCDLRLITRVDRANELPFAQLLQRLGITLSGHVEFKLALAAQATPQLDLDVGDNELFITTSWQSTWSTQQSVAASRIIYLLQQDERQLYPAGEENLVCSELLMNPEITFLVSSQSLLDHFRQTGVLRIGQSGNWCAPDLPAEESFFAALAVAGATRWRVALTDVLRPLAAKFR